MTTMHINSLSKRFGRTTILKDINLKFDSNGIYGLFGRNGVGKSTLLNMIVDGIRPTDGTIEVDGQNVKDNGQALTKLWLMNASMPFGKWTSVTTIMKWVDAVYGDFDFANAKRMLQEFGVKENAHVGRLSTGQQTSLKLVLALNVNATIIMLDEPVLGLDANHRELFYSELLRTYSEKPRIFIVATHLIDEIAHLVNHVIIIDQQHVVIDDATDTVLQQAYQLSGPQEQVTAFSRHFKVINHSARMGKLGQAVIYDQLPTDLKVPADLTLNHLDLQSLFIAMTSPDMGQIASAQSTKEAHHHE